MLTTNDVVKLKEPTLRAPIIKVLSKRFSPRNVANIKIKESDLVSIFEAARWAPSARNRQPWYYYYAKKGSRVFEKLVSILPNFNQWANQAALFIVACHIPKDELGENSYSLYDLGASVFALIIQAQALGFYARQMGEFDIKQVKQIIGVQNHEPFIIIALGKLGSYEKVTQNILDRDLVKRERKTEVAKEIS